MAGIIWAEPALNDLDAIADYIALENPVAASMLVKRVLGHVGQLADHPESGSRPRELGRSRYRRIVEPPCRVFYRHDGRQVFVLCVMRSERLLRPGQLAAPSTSRGLIARGSTPVVRHRPARSMSRFARLTAVAAFGNVQFP